MRTSFALSAVVLYALFAAALLFQLVGEKRNPSWQRLLDEGAFQKDHDSGKYVLHQSSNRAIIDVDSTVLAEAIYSGKVKIVCAQPGSSTLIRIMSGEPGILEGKLQGSGPSSYVESNGKVVVANGAGIIVRASAIFDWDEEQGLLPIEIETDEKLFSSQPLLFAPADEQRVHSAAHFIDRSRHIRGSK